MERNQSQSDFQLFNVLWNYGQMASHNRSTDLQQSGNSLYPWTDHQLHRTIFKSIVDADKDSFRNAYGLDFKKIRRSASTPTSLRIIKKLCQRHGWRSELGVIQPEEVINLDKETKGHLVDFQQIPAYFYNQNGSEHEKVVRYIFGKYFVWFGRKRFVLSILKQRRIKDENKTIYLQVMSMMVQRVQQLLEKIDSESGHQPTPADEHAEKYF